MKKWLTVILVAVLLTGCAGRKKPTGSAVVDQITVSYQENGAQITKNYTSQHKMRLVLDQFRLLGQKYTPHMDPDTLRTTVFEVRLMFSNGSQRLYHTRSDRYIRTDNGPWQQTDPVRLQKLNDLLLSLPPDIG